jgi:predicted house-cleaning noncanonical NTP pyrophosphatase (MazG superfamily)
LQDFDKDTSIDYRFENMIANIRVLYRRALYDECKTQIQKTRKLANTYEHFEILLELLRWEKQIAYAQGDIAFLTKKLQAIVNEELALNEKLKNYLFYKNTFYEVYATIRQQGLLTKDTAVDSLTQKMKHEMLQSDVFALSKKGKIFYYRSRSLYAYYARNNEDFYEKNKILLRLMEDFAEYLQEEVAEHISVLSNIVLSCSTLKKYDEANENIEKFRLIQPRTQDDKLKIHRQYYQAKLQWCISTINYDIGLAVMAKHLIDKQKFENQDYINSGFYYAFFCISFGAAKYDLALENLNEWLGAGKTQDRQDLQIMARLLNLILHYEMGNTYLLDSLLRSTSYYINKHSKIEGFERLLMRFIREAQQSSSKAELVQISMEIKQEFKQLAQDSTQSAFTQYFDFIAWIDSKISGKSFAEMQRELVANN